MSMIEGDGWGFVEVGTRSRVQVQGWVAVKPGKSVVTVLLAASTRYSAVLLEKALLLEAGRGDVRIDGIVEQHRYDQFELGRKSTGVG